LDGDKFVFLDFCVKNWFWAHQQDCINNKVIKARKTVTNQSHFRWSRHTDRQGGRSTRSM